MAEEAAAGHLPGVLDCGGAKPFLETQASEPTPGPKGVDLGEQARFERAPSRRRRLVSHHRRSGRRERQEQDENARKKDQ
jgi:hypothetical protein